MNRTLNTVLLLAGIVCTALGQAPALGTWQPVFASLGWGLAAVARGLDIGRSQLPPTPQSPTGPPSGPKPPAGPGVAQ